MRIILMAILLGFSIKGICQSSAKLIVPAGHKGYTEAVFSPDNRQLLTYGEDLRLTIWEVASARIIGYLNYDKHLLKAFFLPDKKTLVTVSDSLDIVYWNWNSKKILATYSLKLSYYSSKTNATNTILSVLTKGGVIVNWDITNRKKISAMVVDPEKKGIGIFQVSADGEFLVTSFYRSSKVTIWKCRTGLKFKEFLLEEDMVEGLNFLDTGPLSLVYNDSVYIYSLPRFIKIAAFYNGGDNYFQTRNKNWYLGGKDPLSRVMLNNSGLTLYDQKGELQNILSFSRKVCDFLVLDSTRVLTIEDNGVFSVYNYISGESINFLEQDNVGYMRKLSVSSDNKLVAVTSADLFGQFSLFIAEIGAPGWLSSFVTPAHLINNVYRSPLKDQYIFLAETNIHNWAAGSTEMESIGNMKEHFEQDENSIKENYLKFGSLKAFSQIPMLDNILVNWRSKRLFTKGTRQWADTLKTWDLVSLKKTSTYSTGKEITALRQDPNGNFLFLAFDDSTFCFLYPDSADQKPVFHSVYQKIRSAKISPDGSFAMLVTEDSLLKYDLINNMRQSSLFMDPDIDEFFVLNSACTQVLKDNGHVISFPDGNLLYTVPGISGDRWKIFDRSDSLIIYQSTAGTINVYDVRARKLIREINGYRENMYALRPDEDPSRIWLSLDNRSLQLLDIQKGREIANFYFFGASDFIIRVPEGYFMGTPGAARLLHYTKEEKVIGFEQLDAQYNRPDLVLKALGGVDTTLIRSYYNAWQKRIKRLNIDTTNFHQGFDIPVAEIKNRNELPFTSPLPMVKIHFSGNDAKYPLAAFNVWVNQVPVFGKAGASLRKNDKNRLDTTVSLSLSGGLNRIEASITNVNGTESYRSPVFINYQPKEELPVKMYFIGIGIDRFRETGHDLKYSCKDIRDLAAKFKEKYGEDIIIDTLFNEQVTVNNIKAIKKKLAVTTVDDGVIVSYSGHGLLNKDLDYFLSAYDVDFKEPDKGGLPYEELELLLDSIPARKKLLLIDACHSGEVDKDDTKIVEAGNAVAKDTKGGITSLVSSSGLGMQNSFELMQNLFLNVGTSTGATIISAAGGTQYALESGDLKNGVFTYSILEAMEQSSSLRISDLKKIVGARVLELTNGKQKPTYRRENLAVDWQVF